MPSAARTLPAPKIVQAKTPTHQNRQTPAAPPVHRPQATPKVLQRKASPVVQPQVNSQSPKPTTAQQPNSVLAQRRAPAPPPAYQPLPTPRVLQTKKAAHQSMALTGRQRSASSVQLHAAPQTTAGVGANTTTVGGVRSRVTHARPSTIQLAEQLVRKPFTSKTRNTLKLKYGQHRRHIIPNHLMKNMLQSWWDAHENEEDIEDYTSLVELQTVLDE